MRRERAGCQTAVESRLRGRSRRHDAPEHTPRADEAREGVFAVVERTHDDLARARCLSRTQAIVAGFEELAGALHFGHVEALAGGGGNAESGAVMSGEA